MTTTATASVSSIFASALRSHPCTVWEADLPPRPLPVDAWRRDADAGDDALLAHCDGPTLDIGCGPGRMNQARARRGRTVRASR